METEFEKFRMAHLVRTAAVWKRLLELGASEDAKLDFHFQFNASSKKAIEVLKLALADYTLDVSSRGLFNKNYVISGKSGSIVWSEKQLLNWVDYLIQVGEDAGCPFDGCGANVS